MHRPTFSPHSIKSRVAETIIEELFLASDHNVFHYGRERKIPGLVQLSGKTAGRVDQLISAGQAWDALHRPDFVVQDPRNKNGTSWK